MTADELLAHPIAKITWRSKHGKLCARWCYILPGNRRRWCSNADAEARANVLSMAGYLARQTREHHILQAQVGSHAGEGELETDKQREARLAAERFRARAERKAAKRKVQLESAAAWGYIPEPEPDLEAWRFVSIEAAEPRGWGARRMSLEELDQVAI